MIRKLLLFCLVCSASLSHLAEAQTIKYDLAFRHWGQFYTPWQDWHWWRTQGIAESGLRQDAVSPAGAIGVMQLMPQTAKALGVDPLDAEQNIQGGIKYDARLWLLWGSVASRADRLALTLASYNAGPGNIQRAAAAAKSTEWAAVAAALPKITGRHSVETVGYVARIVRIHASAK